MQHTRQAPPGRQEALAAIEVGTLWTLPGSQPHWKGSSCCNMQQAAMLPAMQLDATACSTRCAVCLKHRVPPARDQPTACGVVRATLCRQAPGTGQHARGNVTATGLFILTFLCSSPVRTSPVGNFQRPFPLKVPYFSCRAAILQLSLSPPGSLNQLELVHADVLA